MTALDPQEENLRLRRIPVQMLIEVRQEYMLVKGCDMEPTVGQLVDYAKECVERIAKYNNFDLGDQRFNHPG
jgi:hypothetical protein